MSEIGIVDAKNAQVAFARLGFVNKRATWNSRGIRDHHSNANEAGDAQIEMAQDKKGLAKRIALLSKEHPKNGECRWTRPKCVFIQDRDIEGEDVDVVVVAEIATIAPVEDIERGEPIGWAA